ncbi:Exodeoxyribonuclease V beta chain [Mesorhizobium escarrei]|uniref:Exodeoxyribonuclease V beta chain n=2 Tax=Mesorhizobium escarrei TaxID=666018 RepID=A0ABM9EGE6_9HYPH|nr:Exodeoxyribonuclease V beta chain [Mesorhizobium escarrei]
MPPTVLKMKFDRELVIATDGFWAELGAGDQALFLNGRDVLGAKGDDRSVLCLRPLESAGTADVQSVGEANNLYL